MAGIKFYYRNPLDAAGVILGSIDVSSLTRGERRRLADL